MKRRCVCLVIAALCGAMAPIADGQDLRHEGHSDTEGPPLSLRAALDEAVENNPDLAALRAQVKTASLRAGQERFLPPPMLEAQIWQWPLNTLNPWNTNMFMFMATQDVPGRGKRALRETLAATGGRLADLDVSVRARQIVNEVKQAYADLFIARRTIDIHLAMVDLLRQFADVSEARYTTGRSSQQDVLKASLELSRMHDDLVKVQQQADLARLRLNVLMNREPDAAIGALAEAREQKLTTPLAELQRAALDAQPELRMSQAQIEQAEAQVAVARSDYRPDLSIGAGYQLMPGQTDAWLGKVSITWPRAPWSRGRIDARVAEAASSVETARARKRSIESMVKLAVQQAYVRVAAAEERAVLLRTTILPQSRQTLDVSRIAYQTDRVEFLAMLDSARTLLDAQLEYERAVSDLQQALADLERAVGADLTPEMTVPVNTGEVPR
jgi:cobalt-zinc-cadmium efflux system outer membrane protein